MASLFRANNKDKSESMYWNRLIYRTLAFTQSGVSNTAMIRDFWNAEGILYGRVDTKGQPIIPKKQFLKGVPSDGKKVLYALDFVADAFIQLQTHVENSIQNGCLPPGNPDGSVEPYLSPVEAVRAYTSINQGYKNYMMSIYSNFYNSFLENLGKTRKVTNFDDFMSLFMEYAAYGLGTSAPFNRSAYAVSPFSSILATGLVIDIAEESAGDDAVKETKFLDNPRLEFYKNLAKYYGFYIDKNVPWRLVANLQSSQMQEHILKRYPAYVELQGLFDRYYTPSVESDYEAMKNHLIAFYNRLTVARPLTVHAKSVGACVFFERIYRTPVTREYVNENYDESYWLDIYIHLRNNESHISYPPPVEAQIIKNAQNLAKTLDLERAISYIEYKFKNMIAVPGSTPNSQVMDSMAMEDLTWEEKNERAQIIAQAANTVVY